MRNLLIGIPIGISLTNYFGVDVFERYIALIFLSLAGIVERTKPCINIYVCHILYRKNKSL